ncbi:hypothetical protein ACLKA7_006211 [Drosophila subpalustris]
MMCASQLQQQQLAEGAGASKCLRPEQRLEEERQQHQNEMPEGSKFKRLPEKPREEGRGAGGGDDNREKPNHVACGVFTAMCIVCKSARPSRHLQE